MVLRTVGKVTCESRVPVCSFSRKIPRGVIHSESAVIKKRGLSERAIAGGVAALIRRNNRYASSASSSQSMVNQHIVIAFQTGGACYHHARVHVQVVNNRLYNMPRNSGSYMTSYDSL